MEEVTLYTLRYIGAIWLLAICIVGFVLGFAQVLALICGTGLLCWFYWRSIGSQRLTAQFDGVYVYQQYYMEVK